MQSPALKPVQPLRYQLKPPSHTQYQVSHPSQRSEMIFLTHHILAATHMDLVFSLADLFS